MWTPKRILLLTFGFTFFLSGYFAYARYLGGINGLPPLPERYAWSDTGIIREPPLLPPNDIDERLREAFGADCQEVKRHIKIRVGAQGLLMASEDFKILKNGQLQLRPISVAVFGKKKKSKKKIQEINTLRAAVANLTFERPIRSFSDIGKSKIIAANIEHRIRIRNNRRTKTKDDDILMSIETGPLFYDSRLNRIWTQKYVRLEDFQSKPIPHLIKGAGMRIDLIAEDEKQVAKKKKEEEGSLHNVSGVERITLLSNVEMNLYVDARSSFLSSQSPTPSKPKKKKPENDKSPPEKAHLLIRTPGQFVHDLLTNEATFELPKQKGSRPLKSPKFVTVTRTLSGQLQPESGQLALKDTLSCDHLKLKFQDDDEKKKEKELKPRPTGSEKEDDEDGGIDLQVETARATGRSVVLTSEKDSLVAYGDDFFYDAKKSITILKGPSMTVEKEGNVLYARELHIQNQKTGARSVALGPGRLQLFDTKKQDKNGNDKLLLLARWSDRLITDRVEVEENLIGKPGTDKVALDVLRFIGDAVLIDEANKQRMQGDELTIWLDAETEDDGTTKKKEKKKDSKESDGPDRQPRRLIAIGNVKATSPDFIVRQTEKLDVRFEEPPPELSQPEKVEAPKVNLNPARTSNSDNDPGPRLETKPKTEEPKDEKKKEKEKKNPIILTARTIDAVVVRLPDETQLRALNCEGSVHVEQAPASKKKKGVDITGDKLRLDHYPEGNKLKVTSDVASDDYARLSMEQLTIFGPEVNIDQVNNKVWVNGHGAMTMDSKTDFQGNELKKAVPLNVYWDKSMWFNGRLADFYGDIQADQGTARLKCVHMIVHFDKPISLKQNPEKKPAGDEEEDTSSRVRNLVCTKNVRVWDRIHDKDDKLQKLHLLRGSSITYENKRKIVRGTGPGDVLLIQRGENSSLAPGGANKTEVKKPDAKKNDKDKDILKLTYVVYGRRMYANDLLHVVKFENNVRVRYFPLEPEEEKTIDMMNPEKIFAANLRDGALDLRCDYLDVMQSTSKGGKITQELKATGRVVVRSSDFKGWAEEVNYNEEKDQVIFDGKGGDAILQKFPRRGARPQKIIGKRIIYIRKTGQYYGEALREASQ